jgi:hypothetical protein
MSHLAFIGGMATIQLYRIEPRLPCIADRLYMAENACITLKIRGRENAIGRRPFGIC